MPSDAHGQVWIDELRRNVPEGLDVMADPSTQTAIIVPAEAKPIVR
jgi:NAD+ synthase (glutamine-hydrolysing)